MTLTAADRAHWRMVLEGSVALIEAMAAPGAIHASMNVKRLRVLLMKLREAEQSTQVYRREQR